MKILNGCHYLGGVEHGAFVGKFALFTQISEHFPTLNKMNNISEDSALMLSSMADQ